MAVYRLSESSAKRMDVGLLWRSAMSLAMAVLWRRVNILKYLQDRTEAAYGSNS